MFMNMSVCVSKTKECKLFSRLTVGKEEGGTKGSAERHASAYR